MSHRISLVLMLVVLSLVVGSSSCRKSTPTIAVIPRTSGTLLWEAEHTGVQREAANHGLNVYWNAPMREDDVQGQIDILTRALNRGVKGLIVSPVEALPLRISIHRALLEDVPRVVESDQRRLG